MTLPVVREVEVSLPGSRKRRLQHGEVPYPITYSRQMADFDIWDHMFLTSYCKSLTSHRFVRPPVNILDIGCGSGYWAIETAKKWPNSRVVGFDIMKIQPLIHKMDHLKALSKRIEWVHGNLLDGLPFPPEHFDFVRISGLGLAIPEDEWHDVLEDIHRVLRPGALIEIIEEDLIFPCASALLQKRQGRSSSPSSSSGASPIFELYRSRSTIFQERTNVYTETLPSDPTSSGGLAHSSTKSSRSSTFSSSTTHFKPSLYSSTTTLNPQSPPSSTDSSGGDTDHPQDHTRLKQAWDTMLSDRFLSPRIVSVIPFYLTSSSFTNTQSQTPLVVPLPPNSGNASIAIATPVPLKAARSLGSIRSDKERDQLCNDTLFDWGPSISNRSMKSDGCSVRSSSTMNSRPPLQPNWDTMHLAKTVSKIRGCKEAIWAEYDTLYGKDALQILLRTAPTDEDWASLPELYVRRRAFELDWRNWEFDMMDRMNMRNSLVRHLSWTEKPADPEGPEWAVWRKKLDRQSGAEIRSGHLVAAYSADDLCRSLRAFTGIKA